MATDYEIFKGKTLSDVFKDIYDNSKTNKQQLEVLMKEVVGLSRTEIQPFRLYLC